MPVRKRAPANLESVAQLIDVAGELSEAWAPEGATWYPKLWFRGHAGASWSLDPGWHRYGADQGPGADWYNEGTLLEEFKLRAPRYLERIPSTDWEWLFLMQHHGLPTRLLDWTESALIGLYFALRGNPGDEDGALWVLNPWWLNHLVLGEYIIPYAGDDRIADWEHAATGNGTRPELPVAIKPVHATHRISVQKGFFTIHGAKRAALDEMASRHSPSPQLLRLTIPRGSIVRMRRDLAIAGITESSVYPEIDGLSRETKEWFFGL